MKTWIVGFAILFSNGLAAQQKAGTILFEKKVNMHKMIQNEEMKAFMPEFRTSNHILQFSDSVSIYKLIPDDEAPDPFEGGGGGRPNIMMRMGGADAGELYFNFAQSKTVQATELGGKNFLIVDSIKQQPWKMGEETKKILGHTCYKASRKVSSPLARMSIRSFSADNGNKADSSVNKEMKNTPKEIDLVVWYATDIITPAGPESYGTLPGAILEVNLNEGQTLITATEIKNSFNAKELKEPSKGKVVTQLEYRKMMMEMFNQQGGPGMMRMRREN
jgi:GLPGLI family protein